MQISKMSAPIVTIVQYVVVRGDLLRNLKWPIGAVIAQACHACSAVVHMFYDDTNTQAYMADLDRMHKIVLEVSLENNHLSPNDKFSVQGYSTRKQMDPIGSKLL